MPFPSFRPNARAARAEVHAMTNTQRKVVLITGASRGIGRASALLA
ncbi:NAD(P)-dependent oxidoreductase, partial [Burkholderia pseudomallei]